MAITLLKEIKENKTKFKKKNIPDSFVKSLIGGGRYKNVFNILFYSGRKKKFFLFHFS